MKSMEGSSAGGQGGIEMQLENMKEEFPVMPEEMRAMVKQEVEKQIETQSGAKGHRKGAARRYLIIALAAVMALGMTVTAGSLWHMRTESNGKYGVDISVERDNAGQQDAENPDGQSDSDAQSALNEIAPVKVTMTYLPEGMIQMENDYAKYCYEDALYQGGVTVGLYRMDTGNEAFTMQLMDVVEKEELSLNGYDGIYLRFANNYEDKIVFNQRLYVMYPDRHYVLEMFVGSNVTKEEAVAIAEGVRLTPASEEECARYAGALNWSEYLLAMEERETVEIDPGSYSEETEIRKDAMSNTHAVGESFSINMAEYFLETEGSYTVQVSQVQVFDNIGVLDLGRLDADWREELLAETDEDGNLLPGTMKYIKYGDGVNTLREEVVLTEEVPQKLVYITVDYTNTGDTELTNVLFWGNLIKLAESGDRVRIREGKEPGAGDHWDITRMEGPAGFTEMYYYDAYIGDRSKNYIASIEPGETATVHLGWIVPEEELEYLYLNLDPLGGTCFSESALTTGYVDIRQ